MKNILRLQNGGGGRYLNLKAQETDHQEREEMRRGWGNRTNKKDSKSKLWHLHKCVQGYPGCGA